MLIIPLRPMVKEDVKTPLIDWLDAPPSFEALENPSAHVGQKPTFFSRDCMSDLTRLQSLRNCLADALLKPQSHQHALEERALLDAMEYHATLLEFEARSFPVVEEVLPSLKLTWKASVGPQSETHSSLTWDRANILWNLAALESFLASECSHSTKEGRKEAVQHSQKAASYIHHLRSDVIGGLLYDTVDFSSQSLEFWEAALKAQAQTCAYEMASIGSTNDRLLSYLAIAAAPIFNEALQLSQDALLRSQLPKPMEQWGIDCKAWSMYLQGKAQWHQAKALKAEQEWGYEISRLKAALKELEACKDFVKNATDTSKLSEELRRNMEATYRLVRDRLEQAEQDNLLYGEEVPSEVDPIRPHPIAAKADLPLPNDCLSPQVNLFRTVG